MQRSRVVAGISVVAAVAVGGVGGALIGVPSLSGAQPFPQTATLAAADATKAVGKAGPVRSSPLIDAAAKALGLTTQQLITKLSDGKTTIADVAKQQKVDINTVITAMTNADKDRISKIVNSPWPKRPAGGPAAGVPGAPGTPGAPGGQGGPGRGFGRFGGFGGLGRIENVALDPVAKALGITTAQLKTDLANGQSIAQIAKSKNVDVNTIINTLVGDASKKIDQVVTAGHLTQAQADKLKAALKTGITALVNNGFPKGPRGGFGFPGHGGGGGPTPGSKPATS